MIRRLLPRSTALFANTGSAQEKVVRFGKMAHVNASADQHIPELKTAEDCRGLTPAEVRGKFRTLEWRVGTTSGICLGSEQCNICIMDVEHAENFRQFCELNPSALPLLYRSGAGEVTAPPLAKDSCITTDLSGYRRREGDIQEFVHTMQSVAFERFVTFYIGCSFGAEHLLSKAGIPLRHVEQGVNVGMYRTNVSLVESGTFKGPLVVSLRHIPADLLSDTVRITRRLTRSHGMPVHMGDPAYLGINDGLVVDYGCFATPHAGDVPVFWACGVTSLAAVDEASVGTTFTHKPGQMFVCDTPVEYESDIDPSHVVEVMKFTTPRLRDTYAMLSQDAHRTIDHLEDIAVQDPGKRGAAHFLVKGDLMKAALAISLKCKTVAITTGFPCCPEPPHSETDGPPGTWLLVRALLAAGACKVVWLVDESSVDEYGRLMQYMLLTDPYLADGGRVQMVKFDHEQSEQEMVAAVSRFDHLIAVERASPNAQGVCCRMTGDPLYKPVDPIEKWFEAALKSTNTVVTCIGDGGNEMGMAKEHDQVVAHVAHGEKIVSSVSCDFLIAAGVSNWGAYALAASIYALRSCEDHSYYQRCGLGRHVPPDPSLFLPSLDVERGVLAEMHKIGFQDGAKCSQSLSVDGFLFDDWHAKQINAIRKAVGQ